MKFTSKQLFGVCIAIGSTAAIAFLATVVFGTPPAPSAGAESPKGEVAVENHGQQSGTTRKEGNASDSQAELAALMARKYESPQARHEGIRAWHAQNGRGRGTGQDANPARSSSELDARMASLREQRMEQIRVMKESGRIGEKEAEFMALVQGEYESPRERQEAIRAWQEANGAALAAERERKEAELRPERQAQAAAMQANRRLHIADAMKSGRIGPLEGEFQALLSGDYANPMDRQEAIHTWMTANRDELEKEKAARRQANVQ